MTSFFFASFVDIFNQVIVPSRAQVTHHKSTNVYFYIVYCVHYDEVNVSYVTSTKALLYDLCSLPFAYFLHISWLLSQHLQGADTNISLNIQQRNWSL